MYDKHFEKFEREVMETIIAENTDISEILEKQYKSAKVISREFTGVGFFTCFDVTNESYKLPEALNTELGTVHAKLRGLEIGAGFILFVRKGFISTLEGYTYDGSWPISVEGYVLVKD